MNMKDEFEEALDAMTESALADRCTASNPRECTADEIRMVFRKAFEGKLPCQYGLVYSSLMGQGKARIIDDVEEKMKAMSVLMKTQTGKDFQFNERLVSIVAVIRLDVTGFSAKYRPIPENLR